jgi:hypothetical protein
MIRVLREATIYITVIVRRQEGLQLDFNKHGQQQPPVGPRNLNETLPPRFRCSISIDSCHVKTIDGPQIRVVRKSENISAVLQLVKGTLAGQKHLQSQVLSVGQIHLAIVHDSRY